MKKNFRWLSVLSVFLMMAGITLPLLASNDEGDKLMGVWEPSNGRARVKVEKVANKYYGKIAVAQKSPMIRKPVCQNWIKNNPDDKLRTVPLKGYRLLKDFTYAGNGEWKEGTIYDPENGNTYNCIIKMKDDNTLDIRGYIGLSAFGRTDVWKRLQINKK
jgi:uncharacterized protein (DUF2147 family)